MVPLILAVKRILLEKNSIKKALEIDNNQTFDFVSHTLLPNVFEKDRVFHNESKISDISHDPVQRLFEMRSHGLVNFGIL